MVGQIDAVTVILMESFAVLACASDAAKRISFVPVVVPDGMVSEYEKILSDAVTSPCVASSYKVWVDDPPSELISAVTVIPELVGIVPGVTVAVSNVAAPVATVAGAALPITDRFVGVAAVVGVSEKSSTASPSSAPLILKSVHLI